MSDSGIPNPPHTPKEITNAPHTESARLRIVIEGIILATLGFLGITLYQVNASIAKIEGAVQSTGERVNRIADALPTVRVHIAAEELRKPFRLAVVTQEPKQDNAGNWQSLVHILDPEERKGTSVVVTASGPSDRSAAYVMQGIAKEQDLDPLTLKEIGDFAVIANESAYKFPQPSGIDKDASFIIRRKSANAREVTGFVKSCFGATTREYTTSLDSKNLDELIRRIPMIKNELREQERLFMTTPPGKQTP